MIRNRIFDWLGPVSLSGLLICFGCALWADAVGSAGFMRAVRIGWAVDLTILAVTLGVYVWEIVQNRKTYR